MNAHPSLHLHLVSDSTGETVSSVARAAAAQFEGLEILEHAWMLVRSPAQMEKVCDAIRANPGVVLYTVVDDALRGQLSKICRQLQIPCIPVLWQVVREISHYTGVAYHAMPGRQHALDEEYFARMEAVNFALTHDDGQAVAGLSEADIVLVGASRTSKTPTCVYLAYRGFKAGNVPFVPDCPLPDILDRLEHVLVVGLTISPEVLVQIRRNRLLSLEERRETSYVDDDQVKAEVTASRRYFAQRGWPVLDVSRRSVEETAATIIQLYRDWQQKRRDAAKNGGGTS